MVGLGLGLGLLLGSGLGLGLGPRVRFRLGPRFLYLLGKKTQLAMDIQVRKKRFASRSGVLAVLLPEDAKGLYVVLTRSPKVGLP
jgi:hypothetical protein